jgi:hypothetical protein
MTVSKRRTARKRYEKYSQSQGLSPEGSDNFVREITKPTGA